MLGYYWFICVVGVRGCGELLCAYWGGGEVGRMGLPFCPSLVGVWLTIGVSSWFMSLFRLGLRCYLLCRRARVYLLGVLDQGRILC